MIPTTPLYKQLFNEGAIQEYRVEIDGTMYTNESIYSIFLQQDLFDKDIFTLGSFCTSEIKIKFKIPTGEIPRNANIKFWYRYVNDTQQSEWIQKFQGKVTARPRGASSVTEIEAKDVAASTDIFLDAFPTQITSYPSNARAIVRLIADYLGLVVDNIDAIWNGLVVEYPNELSIIDVLRNIAVLSCGNWMITGNGRLRLVQPNPAYQAVGSYPSQTAESLSDLQNISRVTVYWDDERAFTSGNNSGMPLELDCPWATQGTTNATYARLAPFYYKGHRCITAYIDPAIELGDYFLLVNDGGAEQQQLGSPEHYLGTGGFLGGGGSGADPNKAQMCVKMDWTFDGSCSANVEAPANNEYIYDDPYNTLEQRKFNRKLTLGDSYHGITIGRADGIQMVWSPDGTQEHATARYFADLTEGMAFQYRNTYTDQWRDWLYFDKDQRIFRLTMYNDRDEITSLFEVSQNGILSFVGDNYETIAHASASVANAIETGYNYTNQTREGILNEIAATYVNNGMYEQTTATLLNSVARLEATAEGLDYTIKQNYEALMSADSKNYDALKTYADAQIKISTDIISSTMQTEYATKKERSDGDALILQSANSAITQRANEIMLSVSQTYATRTDMAQVQIQADKINWLVQSGTNQSNMTMTPTAINFISNNVNINGVQIQNGTITSKHINSGQFSGLRYYNSKMSTYMTMDLSGEDSLSVVNGNFRVLALAAAMSGTQGVNFWTEGVNWLGYNWTQRKAYPKGAWDFSGATVTGIAGMGATWG